MTENNNSMTKREAADMLIDKALGLISENPQGAFALMQFVALGDSSPRAQYYLGRMYMEGCGAEPDHERGLTFLRRSAAAGYADAEYHLAYRYYFGKDVQTDYSAAFSYASMAASHGHIEAMNLLCDCYVHGRGVAKDALKGTEWFMKYASAKGISPMDDMEEERWDNDDDPSEVFTVR